MNKLFKDLINNRPDWIDGAISSREAEFIHTLIDLKKANRVLELGVASGYSSSIILSSLSSTHFPKRNFKLIACDIDEYCYFNDQYKVGHVVTEKSPNLLKRYDLRIMSIPKLKMAKSSIDLCFIDANHKHPYPALDTLHILPFLKSDGFLIYHDIGLSRNKSSRFSNSSGPWRVFNTINCEKFVGLPNHNNMYSNIGAILIKGRKNIIKRRLVDLIRNYPFEMDVSPDYIKRFPKLKLDELNEKYRIEIEKDKVISHKETTTVADSISNKKRFNISDILPKLKGS